MKSRLPYFVAKAARSSGLVVASTLVLPLPAFVTFCVTPVGSAGPVSAPVPAPGMHATRVRLVVPVKPSPASATITRTAIPSVQAGTVPAATKVPVKTTARGCPRTPRCPGASRRAVSVTIRTATAMKNAPMSQ